MKILNATELKEWDDFTISNEPISSLGLMERAATYCFQEILKIHEGNTPFHIVVGKGNNGGDGLVIARKLVEANYRVRVSILNFSDTVSADFSTNKARLPSNILHLIHASADFQLHKQEVIIDCIFGYGLSRKVEGEFAKIINRINSAQAQVISIDMPSGLFTNDNSENDGTIIKAQYTLTFQCMKLALLQASYYACYGKVIVIDIELSPQFSLQTDRCQCYITAKDLPQIKERDKFAHKGKFGHALLVGGAAKMRGALILAAKSALRSGAGKVSVTLPEQWVKDLNIELPEAMLAHQPITNLSPYTAIGIGPGLGTNNDAVNNLEKLLRLRKQTPLLIDADALNILSNHSQWLTFCSKAVLTPHIGEFKRLCGDFTSDEEKLDKQVQFSKEHDVFLVLKGAHTSIATPDGKLFFNSTGNTGLSTAGSGDVLSGIIVSFLGQGYPPEGACILGVYLHGLSADLALETESASSFIASDCIAYLGKAFKAIGA